MNDEQKDREEEIFVRALELAPGEERDAYLDDACGDDTELRRGIGELLDAHDQPASLVDTTAAHAGDSSSGAEKPGDRLGTRYELIEELGKGGMGTVWLAEQSEPVHRKVALKIIKLGMDTREVVARFEAERRALAMMNHPGIAKVFDAGVTDNGRPFFVMELVHGQSLNRYCDERRLGTRERLALFIDVCRAVQHAHQKGVIHRDINPTNILVAEQDGHPAAKVIDFGVAKAIEEKLTQQTLMTGLGRVIGTLGYMSPEQAGGERDIDTRSDIYSLGVVLYELLTGAIPFSPDRFREAALDATLKMIREEEPPKPSTRVSGLAETGEEVAASRSTEIRKLARTVRGDLDWIVMRALEKDRERRYETANALARDVECYLNDEPVTSGRPSARYRLRKFVRRNKAAICVAAAVVMLSLIGIAATAWQVIRVTAAKAKAEEATLEAQYNDGLGWLLRAEVAEERQKRYPETLLYAANAIGFEGVGRPAGGDQPTRYIRGERNPAAFERAEQWIVNRPDYRPIWASALRDSPASGLSVSASGRWLALASADGRVAIWDMVSGSETEVLAAGSPSEPVADIAFNPLEDTLAIALEDKVLIWGVEESALLKEHSAGASALAWSPGGELLAAAAPDVPTELALGGSQLIAVGDEWDYFKGAGVPSSPGDAWKDPEFEVNPATWNRGPSGFGYADNDDATVLDDMEGHYGSLFIRKEFTVASAPVGGALELVIDYDDAYVAWLNGVEVARSASLPEGAVDYRTMPRSGDEHEAGTAEVVRLGLASELLGAGTNVLAIAGFNDNRGFIGITMEDAGDGVHIQSIDPGGAAAVAGVEPGDQLLEIDDVKLTSSAQLATLIGSKRSGDRVAIKYRRGDDEIRTETELGDRLDSDFSLIPSLHTVTIVPVNAGTVRLWGGEAPATLAAGLATPAARLDFSVENSVIAAAYPGQGARVFLPHARAASAQWAEHAGDATSIAVSPDALRVAIGAADGTVSLWSATDVEQLGIVPAEMRHHGAVLDLAFRPDGKQLASASADGTVKLWDTSSDIPTVVATLCGHVGEVSRVRYLPGGATLASAGTDGSARLWWIGETRDAQADLFAYLERGFFAFDPESQQASWAGGSGFLGVPAGSPPGLWQNEDRGASAMADYLLTRGHWAAAGKLGAEVNAILLADAEKAAEEKRWLRLELRLRELAAVGGAEVADAVSRLKTARAAATVSENEPFTNAEGMAMVWCPATGPEGFQMGSPPEEAAGQKGIETPHTVVLSSGFWIGKYEVTQGEWQAVMGYNRSKHPAAGARTPVETVSWPEVVKFCQRLTYRERSRGNLPPGWEYALPSSAQWEYACRAGTTTVYSFGDDPAELHKYGNYNDRSGGFPGADGEHNDGQEVTAPVGSYPANPWGLHDMHGNVFEWCQDSFDPGNVSKEARKVTDPLVTQGPLRVVRGGSYDMASVMCRSALRGSLPPSTRTGLMGARVAVVRSRQPTDEQ